MDLFPIWDFTSKKVDYVLCPTTLLVDCTHSREQPGREEAESSSQTSILVTVQVMRALLYIKPLKYKSIGSNLSKYTMNNRAHPSPSTSSEPGK